MLADKGAATHGIDIEKIPDADLEAEEMAERAAQQALSAKLDGASSTARRAKDSSDEVGRRIPLRLEVVKKICQHLQRKCTHRAV